MSLERADSRTVNLAQELPSKNRKFEENISSIHRRLDSAVCSKLSSFCTTQKNNFVLYSISGRLNTKSLHQGTSVPAFRFWRGQPHLYFHFFVSANVSGKSLSVSPFPYLPCKKYNTDFSFSRSDNFQHSLFSTKSVSGRL